MIKRNKEYFTCEQTSTVCIHHSLKHIHINLLVLNMDYYYVYLLDLVFRCYWIRLLKVLGNLVYKHYTFWLFVLLVWNEFPALV